MFSGTDKTRQVPAAQQRAAAPSFFRKAGEQESFFGPKQNPTFFGSPVQPKLTVSTPDDPQEREADAVADKVMRLPEPAAAPLATDKKEEKLDRKEEEVQPKAEAPISDKIQCKQEPEQKLQAKACSCGGHDDHTHIQTKPDAAVSTPHNDSNISLYPSDVMRQSGRGPPEDSIPFEQTLASSKGSGSALPSDTRQFMESRIGADFSGVRIHTGVAAEGMSRSVNAQAFAHGSDIYFNSGKYSPDTSTGKVLLAHELTHTVQQGASKSSKFDNISTSVEGKKSIHSKRSAYKEQPVHAPDHSVVCSDKINRKHNKPKLRNDPNAKKDSVNDKNKPSSAAAGKNGNNTKSQENTPPVLIPETKTVKKDKKKNPDGPGNKSPQNKTRQRKSNPASSPGKPTRQSSDSKKDIKGQKSKASGEKGKKDLKKSAKSTSAPKSWGKKLPKPIAAPLPSLAELFGPLPPKNPGKKAAENRRTGPPIMRQVQTGSSPDPGIPQTQSQVIDSGALNARIIAASGQQQQSVAQQALTTKAQLTGSSDSLKLSVSSSIDSTIAAVRESFHEEKQSLNTTIEGTAAQMAGALEARQADALQSGETTKSKLAESFTQNQTDIQLLTAQKSQEITENKNKEIEHTQNSISQQAASARNSGQQKAGTYPSDERGREQANAATGVANETAGEVEKKQPEIIDAITGAMEEVPAAFQEQGQSYIDGVTDNLQQINSAIDEQVKSTGGLLTEQSAKANTELEKLRQESTANIDAAEQTAVEKIQLNTPQVEAEVAEALHSSIQEIDSAQAEIIQQLQKLERESTAALPGADTNKAAEDFATEAVLALNGIGNAAGSGFQQAGFEMSGSFAGVEASAMSSLEAAKAEVTQNLQGFHNKISSGLVDFAGAVDKGLEQQVTAQVSAFTETETTVSAKLAEGKNTLSTAYSAKVAEVSQQLSTTVTQGLAKNDEALAQLDTKMSKAAEDAGWDYDHPILSAIGDIASFIGGVIAALVVVFAIALLVFVAFELLVGALVLIGLSSEVAAAIVLIAGIGLLIYGVYTEYQARVAKGEGGGWGTLGMALLDSTGLTGMYNAFATKGLSPFERGLMFGEGLGKFVLTLLLVRGVWKGISGGGFARAWKGLRTPKVEPPVIAPPEVTTPEVTTPEVTTPEVVPPEQVPPEQVPPEAVPASPNPPVTRPAGRHSARTVKQGTVAKDVNTVIASDVPVAEDIAAINRGEATVGRTASGETSYTVNGRTYGSHPNGTLYPIEGNGFITLDRGGFKALGIYNEMGKTPRAESILDNMGISPEQRAMAQQAHDSGQR